MSLLFFLPVTAKPVARIAQESLVNFPSLGAVRIRAIEQLETPMRLEFYSLKSRKIISTIKPNDEPMVSPISECLRFKIINHPKLAAPLIYLVTVSMGGSDGTFWGQLIGWRENQFQILNEEKFKTAIQGGFFVGDLGKGYGFGVAAWEFIWCDNDENTERKCNESHYDNHRYEIRLHPLDLANLKFKAGIKLQTQNKYATGEKSLREFGLQYKDLRKENAHLREMLD